VPEPVCLALSLRCDRQQFSNRLLAFEKLEAAWYEGALWSQYAQLLVDHLLETQILSSPEVHNNQ
jgi:hypothetical protein